MQSAVALQKKDNTVMASSDITVSGLSKIGNENAEYLVSKIRTIPGFPKEGILFRDWNLFDVGE